VLLNVADELEVWPFLLQYFISSFSVS